MNNIYNNLIRQAKINILMRKAHQLTTITAYFYRVKTILSTSHRNILIIQI